MWGGVVLAIVIAWSVLWAPAQEGRAHLRESLPAMQRPARADDRASERGALAVRRRRRVSRRPAARCKDALTASLGDHTALRAGPGGRHAVQIQMKNASFPAWTSWVDDVRKQFKVQVSRGAYHRAEGPTARWI